MQATLQSLGRRRQRRGGFTLMEVALSLVIFTLMTLMFGAVLPMALRGAKHSNNYSQAAALAQRKVDQLRAAGYSRLFDDASGTAYAKLSAQNIIDGQPNSGTYDFTAVDHLSGSGGFFPPGTIGTITIAPYTAQTNGSVAQVTVTINWTGNVPGSYAVSALIISMPHQ